MPHFEGRSVIVTGAARGIGRAHALFFAAEGAHVVVNDLDSSASPDGGGESAEAVVEEITRAGGIAFANHDDVSTWSGAERLVEAAVREFGDLDILINNAGILRDRMLYNMTEDEWDTVLQVDLKGHFCPLRHAAAHWRREAQQGRSKPRAVINTSSTSGLFGNAGQTNYGAAKMGVAALTIIAADELKRYDVRVNAIAPAAATRLTFDLAVLPEPGDVSPFVAYLASERCSITGRVFFVTGGSIHLFQPWAIVDKIETSQRWTLEQLEEAAARFADVDFDLGIPF